MISATSFLGGPLFPGDRSSGFVCTGSAPLALTDRVESNHEKLDRFGRAHVLRMRKRRSKGRCWRRQLARRSERRATRVRRKARLQKRTPNDEHREGRVWRQLV